MEEAKLALVLKLSTEPEPHKRQVIDRFLHALLAHRSILPVLDSLTDGLEAEHIPDLIEANPC